MNIPNKITVSRIIMSIVILVMLMIPWHALGFEWPVYGRIFGITLETGLSLKYVIAGILFALAALSDRLDGYLARKLNQVTDTGKLLDAIADKVLVNGVLVILAYNRMIPLVVAVVIITRDIITDTCKMVASTKGVVVAASWMGKIKTVFVMTGTSFVFFNNLPFELIHFKFALFCLIIGTVLSVVSGCQYYFKTMEVIKEPKK